MGGRASVQEKTLFSTLECVPETALLSLLQPPASEGGYDFVEDGAFHLAKIKDMTVGSPVRLIVAFSLPLLLGNIFQQLYNMVDTIIVGRTISVQALAAVGATGAMSFLVLGFVMGLTGGFSVIAAQRFGAGDYDGVRHTVAVSVILSAVLTVVVTLVSVLSTGPLLRLMNTPDDIYEDAYGYIVVIFAGSGASVFYNLLSGTLRALGDSRTPLYFLIFSSVVNVVLDFVFILCFSMGVAGAALATVVSQILSCVLCFGYMKKKFPILRFQKRDWRFDGREALLQLRMGMPMALQFSVTAVGVMILQGAINSLGYSIVAAYTAATKIESFVTQPMQTLGITMATYSAQNLGARKLGRIRTGVRQCCLIALVICLALGVLMILFGRAIVQLFVSDGAPEVVAYAQEFLNAIAAFFILHGLLNIFRNTLQGMGAPFMPLMAGFLELLVRTAIAWIFTVPFGHWAIAFSSPAAWLVAAVPLIVTYFVLMRRYRKRGLFGTQPTADPEREAALT